MAGKADFHKFAARARFVRVRAELTAWCRDVGVDVEGEALAELTWSVVALIDAPAGELAAFLGRRLPTTAVRLEEDAATALAERLRGAAAQGELRIGTP